MFTSLSIGWVMLVIRARHVAGGLRGFADPVWALSRIWNITCENWADSACCISIQQARWGMFLWQRERRKSRSTQLSRPKPGKPVHSVTSPSFCWPNQVTRLTQTQGLGTPPLNKRCCKVILHSGWKQGGLENGDHYYNQSTTERELARNCHISFFPKWSPLLPWRLNEFIRKVSRGEARPVLCQD